MADISDLRIDHSTPASSNGARVAILMLAIVLALGAGAGGTWLLMTTFASGESSSTARGGNNEPAATTAPNQSQQNVRSASGFTAAGYVEVVPPGERIVSSLIPGVIRSILVKEGQPVRAGEVVATLETSLLEQELAAAEAQLAVRRARLIRLEAGYLAEEIAKAEARVESATRMVELALANLENNRELAESGVVSQRIVLQSEMDHVEAERSLAEAHADLAIMRIGVRPEDVAIARAELDQARVASDGIRWKLQQCEITCPIDGIVFQQLAQPGQWLSADAGIISAFDPAALQAWIDVNQRDLPNVHVGQRVTMVADAAPGRELSGEVLRLMPRASIERNTVRIKISIEDAHEHLRPDMSLKVTFHE